MKQSQLANYGWLVGGLFIDERPRHSAGYDPLGSSFISHGILANHLSSKKAGSKASGKGWTTQEVLALLGTSGNPHPGNIRDAINLLTQCAVGQPMTTSQTRVMTKSLKKLLGKQTPMERDLDLELLVREDLMVPYEFGQQVMRIEPSGAAPREPVSEEAMIIRQLVEATGAAHGLVLSLSDTKEDNQLVRRWQEKNEEFRANWGS